MVCVTRCVWVASNTNQHNNSYSDIFQVVRGMSNQMFALHRLDRSSDPSYSEPSIKVDIFHSNTYTDRILEV